MGGPVQIDEVAAEVFMQIVALEREARTLGLTLSLSEIQDTLIITNSASKKRVHTCPPYGLRSFLTGYKAALEKDVPDDAGPLFNQED
jgi:hypothetical protein